MSAKMSEIMSEKIKPMKFLENFENGNSEIFLDL